MNIFFCKVPVGMFDCYRELGGSSCVDDSDGAANLKMTLASVNSIRTHSYSIH